MEGDFDKDRQIEFLQRELNAAIQLATSVIRDWSDLSAQSASAVSSAVARASTMLEEQDVRFKEFDADPANRATEDDDKRRKDRTDD